AIAEAALSKPSPFLIYQESRLIVRALRDYMRSDIGEILVDTPEMYAEALEFVEQVMPHNKRKLKHYTDDTPLFNRFQIESQIESAYERTVRLPSGGALVIDQTEALTAIDVNSARATKGGDIEETAFNTNLEAAEEVARQLRLRDLGGLVVIDFIDMSSNKHQRDVENKLQNALKYDRARVQLGRISRFGLMEMSRQRLRPSLGEASQIVCPTCEGHGRMRSIESLSLSIIRVAEEHAMKDNTGQVLVQVPVEIGNYLLNEKRSALREIEQRHDAPIVIVADEQLHSPHYEVTRIRSNEMGEETSKPSYQRGTPRKLNTISLTKGQLNIPPPAVTKVKPTQPAPLREPKPMPVEPELQAAPVQAQVQSIPAAVAQAAPANGGFFGWLRKVVGGAPAQPVAVETPAPQARAPQGGERGDRNEQRQRREGRGENRGDGGRQQQQKQQKQQQKQQGNRQDRQERPERQERPDKQERQEQQRQQQPKPERSEAAARQDKGDARNKPARQERQERPNAAAPVVAVVAETATVIDAEPQLQPNVPVQNEELATAVVTTNAASDNVAATSEDAAGGENGGKRRRGRRGGRRRRRGGGDSAATVESGEHDDALDSVLDVDTAQPEFEFSDLDPGEAEHAQAETISRPTDTAKEQASEPVAAPAPSTSPATTEPATRMEPAQPVAAEAQTDHAIVNPEPPAAKPEVARTEQAEAAPALSVEAMPTNVDVAVDAERVESAIAVVEPVLAPVAMPATPAANAPEQPLPIAASSTADEAPAEQLVPSASGDEDVAAKQRAEQLRILFEAARQQPMSAASAPTATSAAANPPPSNAG
ncbi:MAG: ribonuclease E/G, partial [Proteobacteria bacterium]|nr:ribonuclease E/G [Pseudomonadota bacterium]